MLQVGGFKNIEHEARFITERAFKTNHLEVLIGDRPGSAEEKRQIRDFKRRLKDGIYAEAVYLLTHKSLRDVRKARKIFRDILSHRRALSRSLGRYVSVQVAALDYMQNVLNILKKPLLIEEEKSARIAERKMPADDVAASVRKPAPFKKRAVLKGTPVVPGFGIGRIFKYQDLLSRELETYDIEEKNVSAELRRLRAAMQKVDQDILKMKGEVQKQVDDQSAAIFDTHRIMLKDLNLVREIERELERRLVNAEQIVGDVFRRWEKKFRSSDSSEIQEKAADVADIGRRLLQELLGIQSNVLAQLPRNSVIFAKRLLPSDTVHLDRRNACGIVTEEGGNNSHVAILAKAFDVPLISQAKMELGRIPDGARVIVNGQNGEVILHPAAREVQQFRRQTALGDREEMALARRLAGVKLELGGKPVTVGANVSCREDFERALKYGCDNVGLYRVEQIYMSSPTMPSENHVYSTLENSLDVLKGREVAVRLLDIGGDKTLPYVGITERENPALGQRGVRLLLKFQNLLEAQLRICLRLSGAHNIKILIPMVSLAEDLQAVRKILESEKEKLRRKKIPFNEKVRLGAMIETPSAVLAIDSLAASADFLSIGTNDLLQYTMAADREKINVSNYYEAGASLILKWVREICLKADAAGIECEMCGELAGNLDFTSELLRCGLRHYSVVPHLVPHVKEKIRASLAGMDAAPSAQAS